MEQVHDTTGAPLLYSNDLRNFKCVNGLDGDYTLSEALKLLLADSGLSSGLTESGMIVITRAQEQNREGEMSDGKLKKSLLAGVSAFLFGGAGAYAQGAENAKAEEAAPDRIVVTAQKREQSLEDVPAAISLLTSEDITRRNLTGMGDYLSTVPGVSFVGTGPSLNQVVIRGIGATLREQATVSTYFGEVPLTDSISSGGEVGGTAADLQLVDMQRVEVLKGPQGTLFGAGAIGGVVRNIPMAPDLTKVSGEVKAGYGFVSDSADHDTTLTGVLNMPLIEDTLALRVVGYRFKKGGYVDRVSTPALETASANAGLPVDTRDDQGDLLYEGGRAAILWSPVDEFSLTVTAATQTVEEMGAPSVDIRLGGYNYTQLRTPGVQDGSKSEFSFVNAVAEYDLGWGAATASYAHISEDKYTQEYGEAALQGAIIRFSADKEGDIFELRFASDFEGPLQIVTGGYYEEFERYQDQYAEWGGLLTAVPYSLPILDSSPGANGLPVIFEYPRGRSATLTHKALFGEVSFEIMPSLTATGGMRWYDYDRDTINLGNAFFSVPVVSETGVDESGTIFKAGLAYEPTDDALLYFRWAEGFRLGGGQTVPPASLCDTDNDGLLDFTNAPLRDSYDSDTTDSYEVGGKFSFLDNRIRLNAAAYRNKWQGIPVLVADTSDTCPGFLSVTANAGEARTQGVEIDSTFGLAEGLQLLTAFSYTDTEFLNDLVAPAGSRLPLSPEFMYSVGLQYETSIIGYDAYFRTDYAYVDGFYSIASRGMPDIESQSRLSMRASIDLEPVTLSLYGTNLLNDDPIIASVNTYVARRLPPRVIGAEISYRF